MPPSKSFAVEASAQSAPTYRLKAVIAPRATPRDAVDFLVICQRRMLSQRSRREQGTRVERSRAELSVAAAGRPCEPLTSQVCSRTLLRSPRA